MPRSRHGRSSRRRSSPGGSRSRNATPGLILNPPPVAADSGDNFTFESILHPTDFSETDDGAVNHSVKIALAAKAKLTFLHVGPRGEEIDWDEFPQIRTVLTQWKVLPEDAQQEDVLATGMTVRKSLRKGDDIVAQIAGEVRSGGTKLLVLSTHQRQGLARLMNKPLAEEIAQEIRRPTLFVPREIDGFVAADTGELRFSRVLVPVAKRPYPERAVEAAMALARLLTSGPMKFFFLHVSDGGKFPELELDFPEKSDWEFEELNREGKVVDIILDEAAEQEVDLVVMATQGREGLMEALRGSTTEQVLRRLDCPLLAIPC